MFFRPPSRSSILVKYSVVRKNSSMFEFPAFLLPPNPGQPMHSPSALTEHVSPNLAGFFLLDPVLPFSGWTSPDIGTPTSPYRCPGRPPPRARPWWRRPSSASSPPPTSRSTSSTSRRSTQCTSASWPVVGSNDINSQADSVRGHLHITSAKF